MLASSQALALQLITNFLQIRPLLGPKSLVLLLLLLLFFWVTEGGLKTE